jgi:monofunctional biosynthetic peptidoglycan transglycosylase
MNQLRLSLKTFLLRRPTREEILTRSRKWADALRSIRLPLARRPLWRAFVIAALAFVLGPYLLTLAYMFVDPPFSAPMLRQRLTGHAAIEIWRDLDRISPNLVTQVIVSEDGRFCQHWGVDWDAIDAAIDDAEGGRPRGASTITMQTAKNLFLWDKPAILRKIFELPLAYFMDFTLGKRRVIELYLNFAQLGPGIYGAEAAARYHFHKSAAELTRQEAAQLAASLPAPRRRDAGHPGPLTARIANRLLLRLAREHEVSACVLVNQRRGGNPWRGSLEPAFNPDLR